MVRNGPVDAVVVLGAPPLTVLERRVSHAVAVFRERQAAYLVVSGGAVASSPSEAEIMRAMAVAQGIDDERVVVEDRASNTFENALYTGLIIRSHNWRQVVVVTDAFHLPRTLFVFRRLGLAVEGEPVRGDRGTSVLAQWRIYGREALAFVRCITLFAIGRHKPIVAATWDP